MNIEWKCTPPPDDGSAARQLAFYRELIEQTYGAPAHDRQKALVQASLRRLPVPRP